MRLVEASIPDSRSMSRSGHATATIGPLTVLHSEAHLALLMHHSGRGAWLTQALGAGDAAAVGPATAARVAPDSG